MKPVLILAILTLTACGPAPRDAAPVLAMIGPPLYDIGTAPIIALTSSTSDDTTAAR
jgi:hypothetical protein